MSAVFYKIRLKTGFYETKPYRLLIENGLLVLSPEEPGDQCITIPDWEVLSIGLYHQKTPGIEIHVRDNRYRCTLAEKTDYEKLLNRIKENPSVKIVCEYEGGKAHA